MSTNRTSEAVEILLETDAKMKSVGYPSREMEITWRAFTAISEKYKRMEEALQDVEHDPGLCEWCKNTIKQALTFDSLPPLPPSP